MPRSQFGFNSDSERRLLHSLVKLKQVRMSRADADPNYFHRSFRRKGSDTFNRQEKCAKLNRAEFFAQRKFDVFAYFRKETESEVHLIAGSPSNAANPRIKLDQNVPDRFRRIDGDEEPAELHFRG